MLPAAAVHLHRPTSTRAVLQTAKPFFPRSSPSWSILCGFSLTDVHPTRHRGGPITLSPIHFVTMSESSLLLLGRSVRDRRFYDENLYLAHSIPRSQRVIRNSRLEQTER